ncbi:MULTISPECIES: hypothetical protein [unclassified Pedobacter]|uniref:hypothetical protein n=1 Tax=unclassified Pedobacter TaxID=2628915 RepID=UPI001E4EADE9|nr:MULTISPECIES: hypothetical protein [unclassified Pedobacter]
MRKLFLLLALSQLILLMSCKMDLIDLINNGPNQKKYTVNFRIGGLNHTVGEPNVGFQNEPIKNYITQLSIIVYDAGSGEEVARQTQSSTDLNFGQIAFNLPSTNYIFVAAGSNTPFGINLFYQTPATVPVKLQIAQAYMQYLYPDPYEGEKNYRTTDTFLAKDTVSITGNKTVDLMMQRVIGEVEISFSDVHVFIAELFRESTAISFDTYNPFNGVTKRPHFQVNTAANGPFKLKLLTTGRTLFIDIDPPGSLPIPVFIPIERNKTTKVSGNVLSGEINITIQ